MVLADLDGGENRAVHLEANAGLQLYHRWETTMKDSPFLGGQKIAVERFAMSTGGQSGLISGIIGRLIYLESGVVAGSSSWAAPFSFSACSARRWIISTQMCVVLV